MNLEPGTSLDAYTLVRPLGAGGMGEVWLARDARLGRNVAVKVLPPGVTHDHRRIARFQQEARAASALNHPSVCTIHALGETADGRQFIAMEFIEGVTLRQRLGRDGLPQRDALDIAVQMASAMTAAHAAGIVHRDIKPENVMLRPDGVVKVLDFGLAKLATGSGDDGESTRTQLQTDAGTILGTVAYMSPEQARGQEVDARTDIWSLGAVLYEMVAGHLPFEGATRSDVLAAILERDAAPLPPGNSGMPSELRRIVGKTLRKDREQRYQVMKDLLLDLQALREELDHQARLRSGSTPDPPLSADAGTSASTAQSQPQLSSAEYLVTAARTHKGLASAVFLLVSAVLAGGAWLATQAVRMPSAGPRPSTVVRDFRRLTFDPGWQGDLTWSPNGRSIAYSSDKGGNFDIYVQPVDGGPATQVTRSPAGEDHPTWSPDGTSIVFHSDRDGGGLFIVPAGGGAERRLTSFGNGPQWAPDGSQVLFASEAAGREGVPKLYSVRLDGEQPRELLAAFTRELSSFGSYSWYPDSNHVTVIATTRKENAVGLYKVPLSDGPAIALTYAPELGRQAPTWGRLSNLDWSAGGATLYLQCDKDGALNLWKFTVDRTTMQAVAAERLTTIDQVAYKPTVSPDGRLLAFTMARFSQRPWLFPFDAASGRIDGDGQPLIDPDSIADAATLSRDGSKLAYSVRYPGTSRNELWVTDVVSRQNQRLTNDDQNRGLQAWSRDGSQLAYQWNRDASGGSEHALAVRRMESGEEQLITTPLRQNAQGRPLIALSDWSPDGKWILASSDLPSNPSFALTLWPLSAAPRAETAVKVLASDKDYELWQGHFSPDGRWICFNAVPRTGLKGTSIIFVIPAAGADRRQWVAISDGDGWADAPRWSPDGKLIYFLNGRDPSSLNLWARPFNPVEGRPAGGPFQLTHFNSGRRQLTPAGTDVTAKRLLLVFVEFTGNIWMLDNVDK